MPEKTADQVAQASPNLKASSFRIAQSETDATDAPSVFGSKATLRMLGDIG